MTVYVIPRKFDMLIE